MIELTRLEDIRSFLVKHPGYDVHKGSLYSELTNEKPVKIGKYLTLEMPTHLSNEVRIRQLDNNGSIVDQLVISGLAFKGQVLVFGGFFENEEPRDEPGIGKRILAFLVDSVGTHYRIHIPL